MIMGRYGEHIWAVSPESSLIIASRPRYTGLTENTLYGFAEQIDI
jgi:hypothetical protein